MNDDFELRVHTIIGEIPYGHVATYGQVAKLAGQGNYSRKVGSILKALPKDAEKVLIHDGARCLINPELIDLCAKQLDENEAVILATKVTDTIKIVDNEGFIKETPDRNYLWAAQTPQGFLVDRLKKAHKMAIDKNWKVTDDASLFEILNWKVKIIEGTYSNIKITSPIDLKIAKLFVKNP